MRYHRPAGVARWPRLLPCHASTYCATSDSSACGCNVKSRSEEKQRSCRGCQGLGNHRERLHSGAGRPTCEYTQQYHLMCCINGPLVAAAQQENAHCIHTYAVVRNLTRNVYICIYIYICRGKQDLAVRSVHLCEPASCCMFVLCCIGSTYA